MNKLEYLISRPLVRFDPANKEHRRYFADFLKHGGWGGCPVRFICMDEYSDNLIAQIQRQLLEYYMGREFKNSPYFKTSRQGL